MNSGGNMLNYANVSQKDLDEDNGSEPTPPKTNGASNNAQAAAFALRERVRLQEEEKKKQQAQQNMIAAQAQAVNAQTQYEEALRLEELDKQETASLLANELKKIQFDIDDGCANYYDILFLKVHKEYGSPVSTHQFYELKRKVTEYAREIELGDIRERQREVERSDALRLQEADEQAGAQYQSRRARR
jgi:hypothetical protein